MGSTCVRAGAGGGEVLEDVLEGDSEAVLQAKGEDLDGDAALDSYSHAGADASVDGLGQCLTLLLRFEGGSDGGNLLREVAEVVLGGWPNATSRGEDKGGELHVVSQEAGAVVVRCPGAREEGPPAMAVRIDG